MTWLNRALQAWRIRIAARFVRSGISVLDVGCADCAALAYLPPLRQYVDIDRQAYTDLHPGAERPRPRQERDASDSTNFLFVHGDFPEALPRVERFDAILIVAVMEHVAVCRHPAIVEACWKLLEPGGSVIVSVPSPGTEYLLWLLKSLRLIHGMCLEEHQPMNVRALPGMFTSRGFLERKQATFQLGFNNLFVFVKPLHGDSTVGPL